jgi:hypothetical protein
VAHPVHCLGRLRPLDIRPWDWVRRTPRRVAVDAGRPGAAPLPRRGRNHRSAIAVGTTADSTTTVTRSENWVRSMIPALSPQRDEIVLAAVGMQVMSEPRNTLRQGEITDAFRVVRLVPSGREREAMSREMYPRV